MLMLHTILVFNVSVPTFMSALFFFIHMVFSYSESDFRMYFLKSAPPIKMLSILTITKDKHWGIFKCTMLIQAYLFTCNWYYQFYSAGRILKAIKHKNK